MDLVASFIPQNVQPWRSHLAAVSAFRFIITTNWDLLFEAAYRQIGQRYHVLIDLNSTSVAGRFRAVDARRWTDIPDLWGIAPRSLSLGRLPGSSAA
jgi:hypothetical protein